MTLRQGDLRNLVYNVLEIDSFKSKMGSDENIVTIAVSVKTKEAADDLVSFFEKGYGFILDADATSGEQADGTYKVFVELERNSDASHQIVELADGIRNLSNLDEVKFRYYKSFKSQPLTQESLDEMLPNDPSLYDIMISESRIENYKNFFSRSFLDSIDMIEDTLRIKKIYADPLEFKFVDFGDREYIQESIKEKINVNDFAEIIFLSKYIGDYNITKYGNKLVLENQGKSLVVERVVV
jgi:hypothetical protein